jgi:U3 small nucleolar RNA-associated protein 6
MDYPSPQELRTLLLEHLYDLVRSTLPGDAEATRLLADRHTTPELRGAALVDAVQKANEELLVEVKSHGREENFRVYADFVEQWCQRTSDQHMVRAALSTRVSQGLLTKAGRGSILFCR